MTTQCQIIATTFVITAIYDIIVQVLARTGITDHVFDWVVALKPYFKLHTPLSSALIAGFVGAVTELLVLSIVDYPKDLTSLSNFLVYAVAISGLIGIAIDNSGLFPYLSKYYYGTLGRRRTMITDAWSGLIVHLTVFIMLSLPKILIK